MLIHMGVGVSDTLVRCHTSHKLVVSIYLADNVPAGIFSDLPRNWILNGGKLSCTEINPDSTKGSNQLMYSKMISELEYWLAAKDEEDVKAVLRLGNYDKGI